MLAPCLDLSIAPQAGAERTLEGEATLERFAPLVKRLAHQLAARLPACVRVADLIQAGLIGLAGAIDRYEARHGTQFETYATQRIRGAMLDELRAHDWLPRGLRKAQKRIEQALARLEQRFGRAPSEPELAAELGMSLREYQSLAAEADGGQLVYYEDFARDDEGDCFFDRACPDPGRTPAEALEDGRFRAALVVAIDALPEREKLLMSLYYEQDLTLREIGAVLGVTESRVCQLHGQAVARLRAQLKGW